ncbi:delta-1-pyrroline-5-carboxylate dehydrogenase, mitochondrial-like isoform X2 [Mya arenaria]|uniref:delta-1-pyrroline-5-carboxylate dehydrogenase, mitochondrial-like isoform X2 n=1 Tax=Mya arenaria TaxID=6604 RepID=UPI0022E7567D|nr:delta-1-pyrroline-5-carboxylate dehydrogenase, mitochondrial-like isoform X2 [Mya arenaria]
MLLVRNLRNVTRKLLGSQTIRCSSTEAELDFENFTAVNEPMPSYAPGTEEREQLDKTVAGYEGLVKDVPIMIGDEEIRSGQPRYQVCPFDHEKRIAKFTYASKDVIQKAIDNSLKARKDWERQPLEKRAEVFYRASELMKNKYRYDLLATTMIGQGKNIWQAEIDAAAEMIDFLRFNIQFARDVTQYQPLSPDPEETNSIRYRGCEGFWACITPFNFTAIGGHLPAAPALMGNVALWKPSDTAMLSNYLVYEIYREAGLPAGVINFIPADGPSFGDTVTSSPHLAGINFTGSVKTFRHLWKQVGMNIDNYRSYPRLIGECGGKNMHFVHPSAKLDQVFYGAIQSGFEYSGQKCSALSRMYIPESMWPDIKENLKRIHKEMVVGTPLYGKTFVSSVIDDKAFARCKSYLEHAQKSANVKIIVGGKCDDSVGYYIEPTFLEVSNPDEKLLKEEIFGPIVTVYVYPDDKYRETAKKASQTSPFALTGAIYAEDEDVVEELSEIFEDCAGNFYINDKSTGSVVGQQPFGGSRLSGTNDKAGSPYYLLKFTSPQAIKRRNVYKKTWKYPSMADTTPGEFDVNKQKLPHVHTD